MDQGVVSKFKAYHLHHTFKQLTRKTDGEGKQSIMQFWKDYNIMNATDNITAAWNEVSPNCVNGVWKKLQPEACSNLEEFDEETVIQNIVKLANEIGLKGINNGDADELLQSHGKSYQ
jgi:hypothetical protein